jgi:hypothetical protein
VNRCSFTSGGGVTVFIMVFGPTDRSIQPLVHWVVLTFCMSMFILVINQLDAQNLFYNKFTSCLYMFRASSAHRQEVRIVLYSLWYHHNETREWSKVTKITKITKIY